MQALAIVGATQINDNIAPLTASTGGKSQSKPDAGGDINDEPTINHSLITTKDRAGAGILTVLVVVGIVGGGVWIIL
jgi:hypothetical protein